MGQVGGNRDFGGDRRQRIERHQPGRLPGERFVGVGTKEGEPLGGLVGGLRVMAERLAIGDIVAGAAPGVEQPAALARLEVEDLAGEAEALAARRDRPLRILDQPLPRLAHATIAFSSIRPAVASALPTTPGIPAPGWVPAPTKNRLRMTSSRLC